MVKHFVKSMANAIPKKAAIARNITRAAEYALGIRTFQSALVRIRIARRTSASSRQSLP